MFKILKKSKKSNARIGILKTAHGSIKTPFFMPCATQGAVKHISVQEMEKLGAQILLANTYHLMLRPGEKLINKFGSLHNFMNWQKPILTDSGGFQVFSLAGKRSKSGQGLVKLTKNGVKFKSYIDGKEFYLTPEKAIKIQNIIGSDIMMVLDECTEYPCSKKRARELMELTLNWAERCKREHEKLKKTKGDCRNEALPRSYNRLLFGIVQGSTFKDLRKQCSEELVAMDFDGYALGGVSVGENIHTAYKVLDWVFDNVPYDKPRYVMGMGMPNDIIESVKRGVDMFDCVIPTREGRHGRLFLRNKISNFQFLISKPILNSKSQITNNKQIPNSKFLMSKNFYSIININRAKFKKDFSRINENSKLPELRGYSLAYLHYLFKIKEPLGQRLASLNNLEFYFDMMKKIRYAIRNDKL